MEDDPFNFEIAVKIDPTNQNERDLFRGHEAVPALQVKYSDSSWLLENSVDELVGPNQKLLLTDWEDGNKLLGRDPGDVFMRAIELQEYIDIAYLGDRWTYESISPRRNRKQIMHSVTVQEELYRRFQKISADFELRPSIQGWKHWHLERLRHLVEKMGGPVGFDATGYRSKYKLATDVNRIIKTYGEEVYVNGRIGPTFLEYLPSEMCAFSGKRAFLDETQRPDGMFSRNLLRESIETRLDAFDDSQAELRQFGTQITGD